MLVYSSETCYLGMDRMEDKRSCLLHFERCASAIRAILHPSVSQYSELALEYTKPHALAAALRHRQTLLDLYSRLTCTRGLYVHELDRDDRDS